MKKIFASLALAAFTVAASAGVTGFTKFDYDRANNGQGFHTQNEAHVGVALPTKLGTVDVAVATRRLSPKHGVDDNGYGFEVGYSNGVKLGDVTVTGRAALGRINHVDTKFGGFTGNTQYYTVGAEAGLPVTKNVVAFAGYRFRDAFNGTGPVQNRFTVGADFALSKQLSLRAGYAFTKQGGTNFNGVTTSVSYAF